MLIKHHPLDPLVGLRLLASTLEVFVLFVSIPHTRAQRIIIHIPCVCVFVSHDVPYTRIKLHTISGARSAIYARCQSAENRAIEFGILSNDRIESGRSQFKLLIDMHAHIELFRDETTSSPSGERRRPPEKAEIY